MYFVLEKTTINGVDVWDTAKTPDRYRRYFDTPQDANSYGLMRIIHGEIKSYLVHKREETSR